MTPREILVWWVTKDPDVARDGDELSTESTSEQRPPNRSKRVQKAAFSVFLDAVGDPAERRWEARLYHEESAAEVVLGGIAPDLWVRWIIERLHSVVEQDALDQINPRIAMTDVGRVEVLDVSFVEDAEGDANLRSLTARIVLQLVGLERLEREIGALILRSIAAASWTSEHYHDSEGMSADNRYTGP